MNKTEKFGKILTFCCVFFFSGILSLQAAVPQWDKALSFLEQRFPAIYEPLGHITEIHGDRIVFKLVKGKDAPARGTELLVTLKEENVPVYLQTASTLIRVVSFFGDTILAARMMELGQTCKTGDTVVVPASPAVYLYTNISSKDVFQPYRSLLQGLIERNLEVVELTVPEITDAPDRYGVLLRLEADRGHLICKIQSLYSRNTLYATTVEYAPNPSTRRPNNTPVVLMPMKESVPKSAGLPIAEDQHDQMRPKDHEKDLSSPVAVSAASSRPAFRSNARAEAEEACFTLDDDYKRLVSAELDGNGRREFVLLNDRGVSAFRFDTSGLQPTDQFRFNDENIIALHLHSLDLDGDNRDELLVTLAEKKKIMGKVDCELSSMVLTWKNGAFSVLSEQIPYYLRTIENRQGQEVVIGQARGQYEPYDGPIFEMKYDSADGTLRTDSPYKPADEIYSVYQFNLNPFDAQRVLIIEPSDYVYGYYTPTETVKAEAPRNYGKYREIGYPQKLEVELYTRGGFDKKEYKTVYAPRRFLLKNRYDRQCFLINKQRESGDDAAVSLQDLLSRSGGEDSLVGLTWQGMNIRETWESDKIGRDILDFCFLGDKLYILSKNTMGNYAIETLP